MPRNQLPRFLVSEQAPADDVFAQAAKAWEDYALMYRANYNEIHTKIGELLTTDLTVKQLSGITGMKSDYDPRGVLDKGLEDAVPLFARAANGLRVALSALKDKHIMWNEYEGDTYPEMSGFVVGTQVGLDTVSTRTYAAMIGTRRTEASRGVFLVPLKDMYAIRPADHAILDEM